MDVPVYIYLLENTLHNKEAHTTLHVEILKPTIIRISVFGDTSKYIAAYKYIHVIATIVIKK